MALWPGAPYQYLGTIGDATSLHGWALPQVAHGTAVNGARTYIGVRFDGVSKDASSIPLLQIVGSAGRDLLIVPFRGIVLER